MPQLKKYTDHQPIDAEAERKWKEDAKIREEFRGNFNAYRAYLRAQASGHTK